MDNVHKKRVETMKKKKEAALLGTPGVTKPLGPVSSVKGVQKTPGSPSRLPNYSLATNSNHHVWTKSLVSEQLARYLDDKPASAILARQLNGQGVEKQESVSRPSSATSDIEMPNIEPVNYPGDSIDSEWEEDSMSPRHSRPEDEGYSGEVTGDVPKSIERTASGRPYTKVAGMCANH